MPERLGSVNGSPGTAAAHQPIPQASCPRSPSPSRAHTSFRALSHSRQSDSVVQRTLATNSTSHLPPPPSACALSYFKQHHIISAIWPPPLSLISFCTTPIPRPILGLLLVRFFRRPVRAASAAKRLRLRSHHVPRPLSNLNTFPLPSSSKHTPCAPLSSLPPCSLPRPTPSVSTPLRMR